MPPLPLCKSAQKEEPPVKQKTMIRTKNETELHAHGCAQDVNETSKRVFLPRRICRKPENEVLLDLRTYWCKTTQSGSLFLVTGLRFESLVYCYLKPRGPGLLNLVGDSSRKGRLVFTRNS